MIQKNDKQKLNEDLEIRTYTYIIRASNIWKEERYIIVILWAR